VTRLLAGPWWPDNAMKPSPNLLRLTARFDDCRCGYGPSTACNYVFPVAAPIITLTSNAAGERRHVTAVFCNSLRLMSADDSLPDDVNTLKAMLRAERAARLAAEAEAQARTLLIEKLKLTIKSCGTNSSGNPRSVARCSISSNCNLPTWKRMRRGPRPRRSWRQPRRS